MAMKQCIQSLLQLLLFNIHKYQQHGNSESLELSYIYNPDSA